MQQIVIQFYFLSIAFSLINSMFTVDDILTYKALTYSILNHYDLPIVFNCTE